MKNELDAKCFEDLGFNFICKSDEDDEFSFRKKSKLKNWFYCLVWHPNESNVTISHHDILVNPKGERYVSDIESIYKGKLNKKDEFNEIIKTLDI